MQTEKIERYQSFREASKAPDRVHNPTVPSIRTFCPKVSGAEEALSDFFSSTMTNNHVHSRSSFRRRHDMADGYVDYGEVSEYGRPFVTALAGLVGLSEFVDVTKLGAFVSSKVDAVETELQKARNDRSDVRDERGITAQAEETLRDTVTRFYHHLQSLPRTTNADVEAFFSGRVMGDIAAMKPADLVSKAADVLRGFDTEKNKVIAGLASWKTDIAAAWQNLADAIEGKGGAAGKAFSTRTWRRNASVLQRPRRSRTRRLHAIRSPVRIDSSTRPNGHLGPSGAHVGKPGWPPRSVRCASG